MKAVSLLLLTLALYAQPALAGQGFIEETDTGFYVEYTGDASDKAADAGKPAAAARPQSTAAARVALPPADAEGEAIDQARKARAEERRQESEARSEARRQESETRKRTPSRSRRAPRAEGVVNDE